MESRFRPHRPSGWGSTAWESTRASPFSNTASAWRVIRHPLRSPFTVSLIISLFLVSTANLSLWSSLFALESASMLNWHFLVATAVVLVASLHLILSTLTFKRVFKPAIIAICLFSSVSASFMDAYGVIIDEPMIHNVLETNRIEAVDLFSTQLLAYIVLIGVVPSALLLRFQIFYPTGWRAARSRTMTLVAAAAALLAAVGSDFKTFAICGREQKELRMRVNPVYPVYSMLRVLTRNNPPAATVSQIARDATRPYRTSSSKRRVLLLVVGETARAANFSLNGYARTTNPRLSRLQIINFSQAQACGTSTSVSVRCMFSRLNQEDFDRKRADSQENILDVLLRSGVSISWRDNDSGCKGVCNRVPTREFRRAQFKELCPYEECFDEVLLRDLESELLSGESDSLIVLHPRGSHGPAYYKRTPAAFKEFMPECSSNSVHSCTKSAIVNAYDNTILYTDHLLAELIRLLEQHQETLAGGVFYVSDHGESLGEHWLYLHGLPTAIAPDEQTHVPFLFWLSPTLRSQLRLDLACFTRRSHQPVSHDNVFDSLLGFFDVNTRLYDRSLDVFAQCRPEPEPGESTLALEGRS